MAFFLIVPSVMIVSIMLVHALAKRLGLQIHYTTLVAVAVLSFMVDFAATLMSPAVGKGFILWLGLMILAVAFLLTLANRLLIKQQHAEEKIFSDEVNVAYAAEVKKESSPAEEVLMQINKLEWEEVPPKYNETVAATVREEPTLAEDVAPVEELTPAEDVAPVEESTLAEDTAPVEELTPAEDVAPVEESTLAEDTAPIGESTLAENIAPVEELTLAEDTAPVEELTLAENIAPIEESTLAEDTAPIEEPTLAEDTAPIEESTLAEDTAPIEESTLAEDTALVEKSEPLENFPLEKVFKPLHEVKPVAVEKPAEKPKEEFPLEEVFKPLHEVKPAEVEKPVERSQAAELFPLQEVFKPLSTLRLDKLEQLPAEEPAQVDEDLEENIDTLDDILDKAYNERAKGHLWQAIELYKKALDRYRNDEYAPFVAIDLGNIYKEQALYTKAIKIYEEALSLPAVMRNPTIGKEFKKNLDYLRIVRDVLLKYHALSVPYDKLSEEILQEIDNEFNKFQRRSAQ